MENIKIQFPFQIQNNQCKIIESKRFELNIEEQIYSLLMEINSDDNIYFKLRKSKELCLYQYINKFNYDNITKLFLLQKEYYKDLIKIFHFFDSAFTKKKMKLEYNKEKDVMLLKLNKILDFDEIECILELNKSQIPIDEMFNLLIEEMNEKNNIKNDNKENNDTVIELTKKNIENENRIKHLEEKIKILEDEINKFKEFHDNKKDNARKNKTELLGKLSKKEKNKLSQMNVSNLFEQIKELNSLRKFIIEENNKYLMIVSEGNQGNDIVKYFLEKTNIKYFELIPSQFYEDLKNEKYYEEVLDYIKNIIKNDNILILKDFDKSFYDIFTQKYTMIDNTKYLESTFKSNKILAEVHNNFKVIFIENNVEKYELFKYKFEKNKY